LCALSSSTRQSITQLARRRPKSLIAGCVLVAITIALLIQHAVITNRTDARVAKVREKGLPVTVAELNQSYALPTGATNAADFYVPAFASLAGNHTSSTNSPLFNKIKLGDSYPAHSIAFMNQWVADNQQTIELLHEGAQHPACRYPLDYDEENNAAPDHLPKLRQCMLLLTYDAWLRAESQDLDGAIHSLESAMSAADSVTAEPDWIARLIRIAGHIDVVKRLEEILNRHTFNEPQLQRLRRLFEGRESPGNLRLPFAGSIGYGLIYFENTFPLDPSRNRAMFTKTERAKASFVRVESITTGLWARDRDFYVETVARFIDAVSKPFPAALRECESIDDLVSAHFGESGHQISKIFLNTFSDLAVREARRLATLRVAQTAIAIERFRLAHDNAMPETLDELVPEFLPDVLTDPFDGRPLRYRLLNPGYVIYSISTDGQDDRGDLDNVMGKKDDRFRMLR
jgi:hypothetical protein